MFFLFFFFYPSPPQDRVKKVARIIANTDKPEVVTPDGDIVKQEKPKRSMLTKDELDIQVWCSSYFSCCVI